jgi:hypothetical protein
VRELAFDEIAAIVGLVGFALTETADTWVDIPLTKSVPTASRSANFFTMQKSGSQPT